MANNGRRYSKAIKDAVRVMRLKGNSLDTVVRYFGISKATAWLWLRNCKISEKARKKLQENSAKGRMRGRETMRRIREVRQNENIEEANDITSEFTETESKLFLKILVAIIFWCEGGKRDIGKGVVLINSDPMLIRVFLFALRSGFEIDESKLKVILHLHEYHDVDERQKFWSRVTGIPLAQFRGPYIKPHTSIRKREGYPGCASVRYGDSHLAKKIDVLYHTFGKKLVGAW